MAYHAFISYSHAVDSKLAPAFQLALQRFAKSWFRRRAMRVFCDTNLHLTPRLRRVIESALDHSSYLILFASPESAASEWVRHEVEYWLKQHPADRILIALTGGALEWDSAAGTFSAERTTALPAWLMSRFSEEPLYLDLRWARNQDDLSIRDPRFREQVAQLAATLHGRSKDELFGEDLRQYRRARQLAAAAIGSLCLLSATSVVAGVIAARQRNTAREQTAAADEQSRIALAQQLAAQSTTVRTQFPDRLPLSVLLALEATRLHPSFLSTQALRAGLTLLPRAAVTYSYDRPDPIRDRIWALAFSDDRRYLALARDDGTATVLDVAGGKPIALLAHDEQPPTPAEPPEEEFADWKMPEGVEAVTSAAFSADGRFLATSGNDGSARLWEIPSGRQLALLPHTAAVSAIAFHPSKVLFATGSEDGKVRLFTMDATEQSPGGRDLRRVHRFPLDSGTVLTELQADVEHPAEVRDLAFSPEGDCLAAISTDGGISLSNVETGQVRHAWHAGVSGLGLTFSVDGRMLATANGDFAYVWDVDTAKQRFQGTHWQPAEPALDHNIWIDDVAFSRDGTLLATAGRDATARIWTLSGGQEWLRLGHTLGVETVAFGLDALTLTTGSYDGARLWELPSGRERWRAAGANELVTFSRDGRQVAAGGSDGTVSVFDLGRGDQLARMTHTSKVTAVDISPDGATLLTAADRGEMRLWSTLGEPLGASEEPVYGAGDLRFSHDGRYVAFRARNPYLSVTKVAERLPGTLLASFRDIAEYVLSPRYVAAVTEDRRHIRLWSTSGGGELPPIEAEHVDRLTFDPTGIFLAFSQQDARGKNGVIRVWDVARGHESGRRRVEENATFSLGPEGRFLALTTSHPGAERFSAVHGVDVWDVTSGTRVSQIPHDDVVAFVAFDRSGRRLATIAGNFHDQRRTLSIWALPTGALTAAFSHERAIDGVRIDGQGGAVATLSAGRVYVWNLATGAPETQLAETGEISAFEFSSDGRRLLTGTVDGIAALWMVKTEDLRAEACRRLTRNLSVAEWQQYLGSTPYQPSCANLPAPDPSAGAP